MLSATKQISKIIKTMKNSIRVYDEVSQNNYYVSGLFYVSTETKENILDQLGYFTNTDKSVLYQPKTDKTYVFFHSDVWGRGCAEEVNVSNLIPEEEKNRLSLKLKNWNKARKILFSINHTRKGDDYIYVGHLGLNGKTANERLMAVKDRFPQVNQIIKLGVDISISESSISLA